MRLYISIVLEYKILKLAYNEIEYLEYARTYKKLTRNIYIYITYLLSYTSIFDIIFTIS